MPAYYGMTEREFDEETDLEDFGCLVINAKDSVPALRPFDLHSFSLEAGYALGHGAEVLCVPVGVLDGRNKDGFWYLGLLKLSQEEREKREPIFRERITPWIEDFGAQWQGKLIPQIEERFQRLKKVDVEKLSGPELRVHFEDWYSYFKWSWQVHFVPMYAAFNIYGLFEDICKELLGMDEQHPKFKALMSGFDNRIFQVERGLYHLGGRATELGLRETFEAIPDDEKLLTELGKSEAGRKWVGELHEFLDVNGWRTGRVSEVSAVTWIEKPSLALPNIRMAIARGGVFVLDQERERLAKHREEVEKEVVARLPAERKEMFERLLRASQWSGRWAEEHLFYFEHYANALGRHVLQEIGRRFAAKGVLEDPEDIYFLLPEEIGLRMTVSAFGKYTARKLVNMRKEQYQENLKASPPFILGDMSKIGEVIITDAILRRAIAGVPVVKPELKANLYGSNSAPGVAEGPARVIMGPEEFHRIQPGEVLVTVATSPIWTPVFGIVKGAVTDTGGGLTHALIVGREFGLPVVVGTQEGTRRIKTGERIRVDGDNCCVYILG